MISCPMYVRQQQQQQQQNKLRAPNLHASFLQRQRVRRPPPCAGPAHSRPRRPCRQSRDVPGARQTQSPAAKWCCCSCRLFASRGGVATWRRPLPDSACCSRVWRSHPFLRRNRLRVFCISPTDYGLHWRGCDVRNRVEGQILSRCWVHVRFTGDFRRH